MTWGNPISESVRSSEKPNVASSLFRSTTINSSSAIVVVWPSWCGSSSWSSLSLFSLFWSSSSSSGRRTTADDDEQPAALAAHYQQEQERAPANRASIVDVVVVFGGVIALRSSAVACLYFFFTVFFGPQSSVELEGAAFSYIFLCVPTTYYFLRLAIEKEKHFLKHFPRRNRFFSRIFPKALFAAPSTHFSSVKIS